MSAIQVAIGSALAGLGCLGPDVSITLHDTDLSPLQPKIGDHFTFAVGGVIRVDDYLEANPQAGN